MEYVSAVRTSAEREFQRYGAATKETREPVLVLREPGRISSLVPEARVPSFPGQPRWLIRIDWGL